MPDAEDANRQQQSANTKDAALPPPPPPPEDGKGATGDDPDENPHHSQTQVNPTSWRRFSGFFSKHEWVMVFLTAVIALTGVVGIVLVVKGGSDTQKMIAAAQQQACAAHQFAETAKLINGNIKAAAGKLALQAQDSEKFFRTDERAWIEIEPIKPKLIAPADQKFSATFTCDIYLKNVGKTVAHDVIARAIDLGGESLGAKAAWISNTQNGLLIGRFKNGPPASVLENPVPKTLAPNTVSPVPFRMTCQAPQDFPGGHQYVHWLVGRVDYCDQFQTRHWIKFCFYVVNQRGEIWACKDGNDEDHNQETAQPTASCQTN